ncbi:MAG: hypothetical protein HZA04_03580 [Nitrospinae bacterium]|nr:hypothetical protein [Nitrospinota bacterium]
MAFRLFLPLFFIFFAFLYIALLNPGTVEFQYAPGHTVALPHVALVMFAFLAGTLSLSLVYFFKGVGDVANDMANMFRRLRAARIEGSLLKARQKAGQGQMDKAMRLLENIISKKPGLFEAHLLHGEVLRKTGRAREALRAHSQALALDPANLGAIIQIKEDYMALGEHEAAYRLLEQVRGRMPEDHAVLAEMRDVSVQLGEFHRAAVLQREILSLTADAVSQKAEQVKMAETYCLFAEQLLADGRFDAARDQLDMALKVEPDFVCAAMLLASALQGLSRHDEAGAVLRRQFERTHSPVALLKLAQMDPGNREELFARARGIAPEEKGLEPVLIALENARGLRYRCAACDAVENSYFPQCPSCGNWNTANAAVEEPVPSPDGQ